MPLSRIALLFVVLGCRAASLAPEDDAPVRIGMVVSPRARPEYETQPTPLVYGGGFLNKTLVFETLVNQDRNGRTTPGLARSWSASPDRRTWTFELRPGVRFHSGAPCDAAAVRTHMLRWLGRAEDAFQPAATRIAAVETSGPLTVVFRLTEPHELPPDLAIVNPMGVVGPGAELGQEPPVLDGTGPWKITAYEPMRRFLLERNEDHAGPRPRLRAIELRLYPAASPRDGIGLWALRRGQIDALVEDWMPRIPRPAALKLAKDERFVLERVPGSATRLLTFNTTREPFARVGWRRRVAAAIDRDKLIREAEAGLAVPARALLALDSWPRAEPTIPAEAVLGERATPEMLVSESNPDDIRAALCVQADLAAVGLDVELVFVDGGEHDRRLWSGEFDLAFAWTWGVPYDPRVTLNARFLPHPSERTAVETPQYFSSPELTPLVHAYLRAASSEERAVLATSIESLLVIEAAVVPLYVPERIALRRSGLQGLALDGTGYEIGVEQLDFAAREGP